MYYIPFLNLIQKYFVPSSITCVNSMEVSYIAIAKARGFRHLFLNRLSSLCCGQAVSTLVSCLSFCLTIVTASCFSSSNIWNIFLMLKYPYFVINISFLISSISSLVKPVPFIIIRVSAPALIRFSAI